MSDERWRKALRFADFAVNVVAGLLFLSIFAILVAQTTMRYVFRAPLTTSQEMATMAFIWLIFWTAACCLKISDHIRFDLIYELVPDWLKRIFMIVCNLLFMAVFVYAARATFDYFLFLERQFTASLRLSYQVAFAPYFLFFFLFPLKLAINVAGLVGPGWKTRL